MFEKEVRSEILKDIMGSFRSKRNGISEAMLSNMLELYEMFIDYPDEHSDFAGYHKVKKIITDYYAEGVENDITKFFNFEPFLKKLYYLQDPDAYIAAGKNTPMAGELLTELGIYRQEYNSNGKSYLQIVPLSDIFSDRTMEENIEQAYSMRNIEAHTWAAYSRRERGERFANVLSVYVFLCFRFHKLIRNRCSVVKHKTIDLPEMCESFKKSYEKELKNGFVYVPMHWTDENGKDFFDDKSYEAGRKSVRRIQFSGEAGCGKTTIAKHFAYNTAVRYLEYVENNDSGEIPKVPVYIELKNVSEGRDIISWLADNTLHCAEDEVKELLKAGTLELYLDGVNEMISSRFGKRNFTISVRNLLNEFENTPVVVTDRDEVDINLRSVLTVYRPTPPQLSDIMRFVNGVTGRSKNKEKLCADIAQWFDDVPERVKRFDTPFKLCRLIQVAESGKQLSDDEQTFMHAYVTALLERELVEKMDFMAEPGRLDEVMRYVARFLDSADDHITRSSYNELCSDAIRSRSLTMDAVDCANLAIQLGFISIYPEDMIGFSDEMLYRYFKNL